MLDSVVCASTDWIKAKRAVLPVTDNPLDLTLTFPNALAFLIDDHADNRPAFEYGMGYLLVYKDLMTFMHYMELMKERGESFPVLYQEAICLFFAAVQKDPEAFKKLSDQFGGTKPLSAIYESGSRHASCRLESAVWRYLLLLRSIYPDS